MNRNYSWFQTIIKNHKALVIGILGSGERISSSVVAACVFAVFVNSSIAGANNTNAWIILSIFAVTTFACTVLKIIIEQNEADKKASEKAVKEAD